MSTDRLQEYFQIPKPKTQRSDDEKNLTISAVVVDPSTSGVKFDAKAKQLCWVIVFDMTGVIQKDYALIVCVGVVSDSARQKSILPMRALSALIVSVGVVRDSMR